MCPWKYVAVPTKTIEPSPKPLQQRRREIDVCWFIGDSVKIAVIYKTIMRRILKTLTHFFHGNL